MAEHRVRVSNGKYTFVQKSYWVEIERYDESWHKQHEASNALTSIMAELDAARVVVAALRRLIEQDRTLPVALCDALKKHDALVDDREKPSEWCGEIQESPAPTSPSIGDDPVKVAKQWNGNSGTSAPDFDMDPEAVASFLATAVIAMDKL